ncbi:CCAAT-box-binding transcription factor [Gracilaria domingensis]|nr:CCAAT-box-binding transcription factor [Gracilaria domingensis]
MGRTALDPADRVLALHHLPGQLLDNEDLEGEHWYDCEPEWPKEGHGGPRAEISLWKEVATKALSSASQVYERKVNHSSAGAIKSALNKEKTISDKIAAETLVVQESPLHRLDELGNMLEFAKKKNRRERKIALEALKDLFIHNLLPGNRRLISFENRTFSCGKNALTKRHLIYALFESELKAIYSQFVDVLEECGRDPLTFMRETALKYMAELLIEKPENENLLLAILVNKLGDPERKVSSLASQQLLKLIYEHHPQMQIVVIKEVERLVLRQNVSRKAQYYAVNFLNQIRFSTNDVELSRRFVRLYMDLFTRIVSENEGHETSGTQKREKTKIKRVRRKGVIVKKEVKAKEKVQDTGGTRLLGALLVGVNRAFPYTRPEEDPTSYNAYYDTLFRVSHGKSIASATQALAFLLQISHANSTENDRFYRALYSRIYDVALSGEEKQASFLNLLYRAMKSDTSAKRIKAFMKRLLQASFYGSSGFAGACIMVISESVSHRHKGLVRSFLSLSENDDEIEVFEDVEHKTSHKGGKKLESSGTAKKNEVHYSYGLDEHEGDEQPKMPNGAIRNKEMSTYNPLKRDPQFAGAEKSCLWEMLGLSAHFHPSVSMFASSMCEKLEAVQYAGDPLKDFAEIAFLDKFSYKKAKNRVAKSLHGKRSSRYRDDPIPNSQQFQNFIQSGKVLEDNKFFARFFQTNPDRVVSMTEEDGEGRSTERAGIPEDVHDSDIDSEEEEFEKALHAEMRRLGGDKVLFSDGMQNEIVDEDDENEDELMAFEQAFGKDEDNDVPREVHENQDSERGIDDISAKQNEDRTGFSNVFAPMEDFQEAINAEEDERGDLTDEKVSLPQRKRRRRRKEQENARGLDSNEDQIVTEEELFPSDSFTKRKQDSKKNSAEAPKVSLKRKPDSSTEETNAKRKRRKKRKPR